ncbi:hypothetical protein T11_18287 [Trichinella zimbabwensis]|uniref:Uncharacterized protein n=1 Tax=Trichinella zimbabwensis TaxID=268475 RepID=A0A0V1HMX3_9BILA|nr:hypothetical protein T11_18287 [Trichinella zimbabwensis]
MLVKFTQLSLKRKPGSNLADLEADFFERSVNATPLHWATGSILLSVDKLWQSCSAKEQKHRCRNVTRSVSQDTNHPFIHCKANNNANRLPSARSWQLWKIKLLTNQDKHFCKHSMQCTR